MTEERIIAYLLEELPEEELRQFEDECFAEKSWPQLIGLVEEDLIDAYLRDELTPEQRQRFERNYLTTEARQDRVLMAAALLRHVDEQQTAAQPAAAAAPPTGQTRLGRLRAFWVSRTWALRAAAALAAVVVIAGALWLTIFRKQSPQTFATINLTGSSGTRAQGAQAVKVNYPLDADALRISLRLPEGLPPAVRYRVELENLDDDKGEASPLEIAGQDAQSVSVLIPAAQLTRGRYALKLFAVKNDGAEQRIEAGYFFDVE